MLRTLVQKTFNLALKWPSFIAEKTPKALQN